MQDPGEPEKGVPAPSADDDGGADRDEAAEAVGRPVPRRSRFRGWFTRAHWRETSWRDLVPVRERPSRFEPGPLGLLGVMLAAMAATLLILQSGSGGFDGSEEETAEEPGGIPGPPDGELRLMPVGDSLTHGSSGDYTWRYHLWSHLSDAGVDFTFVGPYNDVYSLDGEDSGDTYYADPDFDTGHAARWGRSAHDLADGISEAAAEHDPHYLLLLAGTEDILAGGSADYVLEGISETVSTVRVVLGEARFVLGELPPVEGTGDDARFNEEIDRVNMGLVDLAEQLTSGDSPVVVAPVAEDYAPAHDNWDEAHPNTRGELKIAAAFADVLAEPLQVGETFPRPLPELTVGPLTPPEPSAEETDDGLLLSWDAVPGATDYRVVQRRVEPDPDGPSTLPVDVEVDGDQRSVLVDALLSGADYEFVVHPFKGRDEGAGSEPLELVWDDEPPPAPTGVRVSDGGTVVWDRVTRASHYEVWVRELECTPDNFRRGPSETGRDDEGDDEDEGEEEPGPPEPDPTPSQPPEPDPPPDPAPGTSCEPRDGDGPASGQGWHTLGSAGEDPRWEPTVSGPYELVVRSHRDYVEGGYSGSVVLEH